MPFNKTTRAGRGRGGVNGRGRGGKFSNTRGGSNRGSRGMAGRSRGVRGVRSRGGFSRGRGSRGRGAANGRTSTSGEHNSSLSAESEASISQLSAAAPPPEPLTRTELANRKLHLVHLVSASLIREPRQLSGGSSLLKLIQEISFLDPEFVLKLALYVRDDLNMRSTANFLLAMAGNLPSCQPYIGKYFSRAVRLPSDWLDVAATCMSLPEDVREGAVLPRSIRQAMIRKFCDFDDYQLGKYNKERSIKRKLKKIRARLTQEDVSDDEEFNSDSDASDSDLDSDDDLGDDDDDDDDGISKARSTLSTVARRPTYSSKPTLTLKRMIRQLHISRPVNAVMCLLGKRYPLSEADFQRSGLPGSFDVSLAGTRMKLPVAETWETMVSTYGNRAMTWEKLIDNGKLPFMAMLRNLKSLILCGISSRHHRWVISKLTSETAVASSRQFPFRFLAAYEAIPADRAEFDHLIARQSEEIKLEDGTTRRRKRHPLQPRVQPDADLFARYRAALDTAVRLATKHNVQPIPGNTVVFCQVGSGMRGVDCAAAGRRLGGKVNKLDEVGALLGLMCAHASENCEVRAFSANSSGHSASSPRHVPIRFSVTSEDNDETYSPSYTPRSPTYSPSSPQSLASSDEEGDDEKANGDGDLGPSLLAAVPKVTAAASRLASHGGGTSSSQCLFPISYIEDLIRTRKHVDSLVILARDRATGGSQTGEAAEAHTADLLYVALDKYRQIVNPDLLFVSVALNDRSTGVSQQSLGEQFAHPNNVHVAGFSDAILRFVAERGDSSLLQYVENIDRAKGLVPLPQPPPPPLSQLAAVYASVHHEKQLASITAAAAAAAATTASTATIGKKKKKKMLLNSSIPHALSLDGWPEARIFISSTFRDFHAERDLITRFVIPELRERAAKELRVHVRDVDLRWGVRADEVENGRGLRACLEEVHRCQPFFVGLLGARYGWRPERYDDGGIDLEQQQWKWLASQPAGRSVTELEFELGFLRRPQRARACVYLRDPRFMHALSADENALKESKDTDYAPESRETHELQQALKHRVRGALRAHPDRIRGLDNYTCDWVDGAVGCLDQLRRRLLDDVWYQLLAEFAPDKLVAHATSDTSGTVAATSPAAAAISANENRLADITAIIAAENIAHEHFAERVGRRLVGRERELQWLRKFTLLGVVTPYPPSNNQYSSSSSSGILATIGGSSAADSTAATPLQAGSSTLGAPSSARVHSLLSNHLLIISGQSGVGKSALLAQFARRHAAQFPETLIFTHFVGAAPGSGEARRILLRACNACRLRLTESQLADLPSPMDDIVAHAVQTSATSADAAAAEAHDDEDAGTLQAKLPASSSPAANGGDLRSLSLALTAHLEALALAGVPALLLLDGLDQLSDTERSRTLEWLPAAAHLGAARVIVSAVEGTEPLLALYSRRPVPAELRLAPLSPADSARLLRATLWDHRKRLDDAEARTVMRLSEAFVPLYLMVACEELRLHGQFERVAERVSALAPSLQGLFVQVLMRLEEDFSFSASVEGDEDHPVLRALCALALSVDGLTEEELCDVANLSAIRWNELRAALGMYISCGGGGGAGSPSSESLGGVLFVSFFHRSLKLAISKRYMSSEDTERSSSFVSSLSAKATGTWSGLADSSAASNSSVSSSLFSSSSLSQSTSTSSSASSSPGVARKRRIHLALANYFDLQGDPSDRRRFTGDNRALRLLPHHLLASGQWERLLELFQSIRYLERRCAVAPDGVGALLDDLRRAKETAAAVAGAAALAQARSVAESVEIAATASHSSALHSMKNNKKPTSTGAADETDSSAVVFSAVSLSAEKDDDLESNPPALEQLHLTKVMNSAHSESGSMAAAAALSVRLDVWLHWLSSQAHILRANPSLCLQQAANAPVGSWPARVAARAWKTRNASQARAYLRWANKPLSDDSCELTVAASNSAMAPLCAVPSHDGLVLLVGGRDGLARLTSAVTGVELGPAAPHPAAVVAAAWAPSKTPSSSSSSVSTYASPDIAAPATVFRSTMFVTAAADGVARLWSVMGSESLSIAPLCEMRAHTRRLSSVDWSGASIATAGWDASVMVWQPFGRTAVTTPETVVSATAAIAQAAIDGSASTRTFSNSSAGSSRGGRGGGGSGRGQRGNRGRGRGRTRGRGRGGGGRGGGGGRSSAVQSSSSSGVSVVVFTRANYLLRHCARPVTSVRFGGPSNRWLVCGCWDGIVYLLDWLAKPPRLIKEFLGHQGSVRDAAFGGLTGSLLASCAADGSLRLWDIDSGSTVAGAPSAHANAAANALDFSSDGRLLLTVGDDRVVKVFDASPGLQLQARHIAPSVSEYESGRGGNGSEASPELFDGPATAIAVCPPAKLVICGSVTGSLAFYESESCEALSSAQRGSHSLAIHAIAIEPKSLKETGSTVRFATASSDGLVKLWMLKVDEFDSDEFLSQYGTLKGHEGEVFSLAWRPDGRQLVTGSADNSVRVWSTVSGQQVARLSGGEVSGHSSPVTSVCWSANSKTILSASRDCTAKVWQAIPNKSDGTQVIASVQSGQSFLVKHCLFTMVRGHRDWINCLAFADDGRHCATGSSDHNICLWDLKKSMQLRDSARPKATLVGHDGTVTALRFIGVVAGADEVFSDEIKTGDSAARGSNRRLVSAAQDGTVRLWDFDNFTPLTILDAGSSAQISALDCTLLQGTINVYSVSSDGLLRLWDAMAMRERSNLVGHSAAVKQAKFLGSSSRVASTGGDQLKVWRSVSGDSGSSNTGHGHSGMVHGAALTSDASHLVTAGADGLYRVWDLRSGRRVRSVKAHTAVSKANAAVLDWADITEAASAGSPPATKVPIRAVALHPHQSTNQSISVGDDGSVRLLDTLTGRQLSQTFVAGDAKSSRPLTCVAWASSGDFALVAGWDCLVYSISIKNGQLISSSLNEKPPCHHFDWIQAVAVNSTSRLGASGGWDGQLLLHSLSSTTGSSNTPRMITRISNAHERGVINSIDWHPSDPKRLASCAEFIRLWKVTDENTLESEATLSMNSASAIREIRWAPTGTQIISASEDCSLRVWSVRRRQLVAEFPAQAPLTSLAIARQSAAIVCGDSLGHIYLLSLQSAAAASSAAAKSSSSKKSKSKSKKSKKK